MSEPGHRGIPKTPMANLPTALLKHEDWLHDRVLELAAASFPEIRPGDLEPVWQKFLKGIPDAIGNALAEGTVDAGAGPSAIGARSTGGFGAQAATELRRKGTPLGVVLDLLAIYRVACRDLADRVVRKAAGGSRILEVFFTQLELALCRTWALETETAKGHRRSILVSMCAWCKKVRNADGRWEPVEAYIADHCDQTISHGICPGCASIEMTGKGWHD
jgi:hypothetical protein